MTTSCFLMVFLTKDNFLASEASDKTRRATTESAASAITPIRQLTAAIVLIAKLRLPDLNLDANRLEMLAFIDSDESNSIKK